MSGTVLSETMGYICLMENWMADERRSLLPLAPSLTSSFRILRNLPENTRVLQQNTE